MIILCVGGKNGQNKGSSFSDSQYKWRNSKKLPVFLYADCIKEFTEDRGGMFWTFPESGPGPIVSNKAITPKVEATLPYPLSRNNEELERNILDFEKYKGAVKSFAEAIELVYDGKASVRAADQVGDT